MAKSSCFLPPRCARKQCSCCRADGTCSHPITAVSDIMLLGPRRTPLPTSSQHGEEHIIHSRKEVRRQPHPPFTLLLRAWKMLGRCLVIGERLCYALRSAEYVLVLRNLEHQMRDAIST
jgi:hypothetical protein